MSQASVPTRRIKGQSQTVIQSRVDSICDWITRGEPPARMRELAEKDGWGVSSRTMQKYVARAESVLLQRVEANRDRLMAWHYGIRRQIVRDAMRQNDLRTALAAARDECELLGLYPAAGQMGPINLQVNLNSPGSQLPADQHTQALLELYQTLAARLEAAAVAQEQQAAPDMKALPDLSQADVMTESPSVMTKPPPEP